MINNLPNNISRVSAPTATQTGATQNSSSNGTSDALSIFAELINLFGGTDGAQNEQKPEGLPQDQDPDSFAQQYADENGISLDEAKEQLEAKYGAPQNPDQSFSAQA